VWQNVPALDRLLAETEYQTGMLSGSAASRTHWK